MRKTIALLSAILLIAVAGCAGPKRVEYKTLASIGAAVDASMKAAADGYYAGKIDDAGWERIAAKHDKFRVAYRTAIDVAKTNISTASNEEITRLWSDIVATIKEVTK